MALQRAIPLANREETKVLFRQGVVLGRAGKRRMQTAIRDYRRQKATYDVQGRYGPTLTPEIVSWEVEHKQSHELVFARSVFVALSLFPRPDT